MRHALVCHPDTPCTAVLAIAADVRRGANGDLVVQYDIRGSVDDVVPSLRFPSTRRRADELWQHTCFEAFVKPAGFEAYWEFNVAPTRDWQVYALSAYRTGRHPADAAGAPSIEPYAGHEAWGLRVHWTLAGAIPDTALWRLGLAAVIEDRDGTISYWALAHAPDKPDFHHADAFALELPVTP